MQDGLTGWNAVRAAIAAAEDAAMRPAGSVALVAVSKTRSEDAIWPLLAAGQRVFGENRIQEAMAKWPALRARLMGERGETLQLHLIGPLQSNKVREAVATFDVIESVDREKIAALLTAEMQRQGRMLPCCVQVNTGRERQKAGIDPDATEAFVARCRSVHGLDVAGLMCIPPAHEDPSTHFTRLGALADACGLPVRSMGMSGDFATAIAHGATHVRVGSAIFGARGT